MTSPQMPYTLYMIESELSNQEIREKLQALVPETNAVGPERENYRPDAKKAIWILLHPSVYAKAEAEGWTKPESVDLRITPSPVTDPFPRHGQCWSYKISIPEKFNYTPEEATSQVLDHLRVLEGYGLFQMSQVEVKVPTYFKNPNIHKGIVLVHFSSKVPEGNIASAKLYIHNNTWEYGEMTSRMKCNWARELLPANPRRGYKDVFSSAPAELVFECKKTVVFNPVHTSSAEDKRKVVFQAKLGDIARLTEVEVGLTMKMFSTLDESCQLWSNDGSVFVSVKTWDVDEVYKSYSICFRHYHGAPSTYTMRKWKTFKKGCAELRYHLVDLTYNVDNVVKTLKDVPLLTALALRKYTTLQMFIKRDLELQEYDQLMGAYTLILDRFSTRLFLKHQSRPLDSTDFSHGSRDFKDVHRFLEEFSTKTLSHILVEEDQSRTRGVKKLLHTYRELTSTLPLNFIMN